MLKNFWMNWRNLMYIRWREAVVWWILLLMIGVVGGWILCYYHNEEVFLSFHKEKREVIRCMTSLEVRVGLLEEKGKRR
jgi:hypothetical protein